MDASQGPLVLINPFEVPPGADDQFLLGWEQARDFLQTQPGYLSTALHQSLSPAADFRFVNLGVWASVDEFRSATGQLGAQSVNIPFRPHPSLYQVIREDQSTGGIENAVALVNPFEVPQSDDDAFVSSWEAVRDYLRGQPGYVDSRLHRSILPNADFRFVNVAHWESPEAFQAAMSSRGFGEVGRVPYTAHPALYRVVRR